MTTAEIWQNIASVKFLNSKYFAENFVGVGAGDAMHSIEAHREVRSGEQSLDLVEVKELLHELNVLG